MNNIAIMPELMAAMLEHNLPAEDVKLAACVSTITPCKYIGIERMIGNRRAIRFRLTHPVNLVNIVNEQVRYHVDLLISNTYFYKHDVDYINSFGALLIYDRNGLGNYSKSLINIKVFYTTEKHLDDTYQGIDQRLLHSSRYEQIKKHSCLGSDMTFSMTQWVANKCREIEDQINRQIVFV